MQLEISQEKPESLIFSNKTKDLKTLRVCVGACKNGIPGLA